MAMVTKDNYEEYMMLYADKELNEAEEKALLAFVAKHPELKAELNAYSATTLQPDSTIVFENKELLLQKAPKRIALLHNWKFYAAAACALLLFGTFFFQTTDTTTTHSTIAQATDTIIPEKVIKEEPTEQTQKKLYSKQPVKAIAMETKKQKSVSQQKVVAVTETHQQEELLALNTLNTSADFEVRSQPITISEVALPKVAKVVLEEQTTTNNKVALNSPLNDATKGLQQIEDIFNDKLLAAKQVKEKIDGTELRFVLGKKQLFTVRL